MVTDNFEMPTWISAKDAFARARNFTQQLILRTGPIISATRRLIWNKQLKRYVQERNPHGTITNYDGKVTRFDTIAQYRKAVATERARWHYYKFFSQYGFKPEEWK